MVCGKTDVIEIDKTLIKDVLDCRRLAEPKTPGVERGVTDDE
jgi:hypothetical protein